MKDNFSLHADQYATYRPHYPQDLFRYILSLTHTKGKAWDCGTGNGQVASQLSKFFDRVEATDISQLQIDQAPLLPNVRYSVQAAEQTHFPNHTFDLIVVAQAIHWFDFEKFYGEVNRTMKEEGLLAVIGYGLLKVSPDIDSVINHLYKPLIGEFWDKERAYVDQAYQTIPFPFQELTPPSFSITLEWTLAHLIGYLETWSAVKHFERKKGYSPIDEMKEALKAAWGTPQYRQINFPILLRIGRMSDRAAKQNGISELGKNPTF